MIGAAFTSISFVTSSTGSPRTRNLLTVGFILACGVIYLVLGQAPQTLLVFAGAFNGLILPFGFAILLWVGWRRRDLLQGYRYPGWLLVVGLIAWVLSVFLAVNSLAGLSKLWA